MWSATATQSGVLWVTRMNSISNGSDGDAIARHHGAAADAELEAVFFDLVFDQRQGERSAEYRPVHPRQHVGDAADMVLVAVGQHQRGDPSAAGVEVVEGRDDQVHARQVGLGEHRAGVDEDGRLPARHGQHVQAELAEPAQRHDIDRRRGLRITRHGHRYPSQAPDLDAAQGTHANWRRRAGSRRSSATPIADALEPTFRMAGTFRRTRGGLRETIAQARLPRRPQVPSIQRAAGSRAAGWDRCRRRAERPPGRARRRSRGPSGRCRWSCAAA